RAVMGGGARAGARRGAAVTAGRGAGRGAAVGGGAGAVVGRTVVGGTVEDVLLVVVGEAAAARSNGTAARSTDPHALRPAAATRAAPTTAIRRTFMGEVAGSR